MPHRKKFRNHDFHDKFLKNYNMMWCFYFWRVLLVITNPLFMIIQFCPPYTLIPPFISGKLKRPQKILEVLSDSPPPSLGELFHESVMHFMQKQYLVGPYYAGPKWHYFSCYGIKRANMFVYESLSVHIWRRTPISASVEGASINLMPV